MIDRLGRSNRPPVSWRPVLGVAAVAALVHLLVPPASAGIASNCGEAGVTILGPARGLHRPVISGHNNYLLWGTPPGTPDTVLCMGHIGYLECYWSKVTEIAPLTLPAGLTDQETERHAATYLCTQPRGPWPQLWPGLRHLD